MEVTVSFAGQAGKNGCGPHVPKAKVIGEDRQQTAAGGYAVPDSFNHGSSADHVKWLTTGLKSGQIDSCDTFGK